MKNIANHDGTRSCIHGRAKDTFFATPLKGLAETLEDISLAYACGLITRRRRDQMEQEAFFHCQLARASRAQLEEN